MLPLHAVEANDDVVAIDWLFKSQVFCRQFMSKCWLPSRSIVNSHEGSKAVANFSCRTLSKSARLRAQVVQIWLVSSCKVLHELFH